MRCGFIEQNWVRLRLVVDKLINDARCVLFLAKIELRRVLRNEES